MFGSFLKQGFDHFNADPIEAEQQAHGDMEATEYEDRAAEAVPGDVFMISGCQDAQTSADVSNVASFGLPEDSGPGGAGGACTNALLATTYAPGDVTWIELLNQMRTFLGNNGYSQVPELSSSRKLELGMPFEIAGGYGGSRKAVLVGINYVNHSNGVLRGCINDVLSMKNYICGTEGFDEGAMRILVDDHGDEAAQQMGVGLEMPTKDTILDAIRWLVSDAQPGDVLFFHYSGHGGQQRDTSGDEEDGKDETLIPEDYQSAGVLTDDDLFRELVMTVPVGVRLVCIMDCCHSGTILDLPFLFAATESNVSAAESGALSSLTANPGFQGQIGKLLKVGMEQLQNYGGAEGVMGLASKFGLPF
eukprot:TRINITY_DN10773_c0_g1_i1.p1 TRINITY_DN10773_c0_g1~~TRINITY_DN10773_c0_g1_i1.p1  ORF type:complete len:362 (+),score=72.75 TRINITY_DN10773_c0_g1_i1:67-1152(+)